ncbi:hypothetical protein SEPL_327 [Salmonella phage SE_PL]|uniref:hypothetical protein n=1 Tax=Salmonella enterica TaxID=28901 RepID=UPI000FDF9FC6|nr:hypothetical protein CPT_Munch_096 [Salmonella phage Munch]EHX8550344.1 hypothetical protein [Salmonella enterica]MCP0435873.1 hypothetical protein [Salmonella enterica subsp. enterica serovar Mbandaka]QCW18775.1 hypothetical protein 7t3_0254 [Salmonella phage 7t3]QIG62940.1 hypothetical protein SEPL_327 [Salmonella phage SE_PL]WNV47203.1 hypothetical protein [Klebsiella phage fENko-Kae01]
MNEKIETEHCPYCQVEVQIWTECSYGVGQAGGIVIAKTYCSVCEEKIRERVIDKDI